ncbi:hypothetical protein DL767_003485 [Monosporascus sp. MG133]|nr:hypothetical protein DL767_003485 [Monosporascus sp. MG133]
MAARMAIPMRKANLLAPLECETLYRRIADWPVESAVSAWVLVHAVYCELDVGDLKTRHIIANEAARAVVPVLRKPNQPPSITPGLIQLV